MSERKIDTVLLDAMRDNTTRIFDETAKLQSLFAQSMTNLQNDYFQTIKDSARTYYANKKEFAAAWNIPRSPEMSEQLSRQYTEMATNAIRAIGIYQQLTTSALEAAGENLKIFNKTVDAVGDFNGNVMKAWAGWSQQQQQQAQQIFRQQ